ncbi:MAG: crossover junction endodeoxyribonuclease RuvC [Deltaproteobacteria bacterium]|nr:crossover junction endodeoxyribonuclease RuvC [Deltaproteobacteria bacterium]
MRVIGVDPGNATTGFGVVERSSCLQYVGAGTVRGRGPVSRPQRLATIYQDLLRVLDRFSPDVMSLERSFVAVNVQSAFALGEARAVAMLAAAHRGLDVFEYTPTDVKLSVAGYGRADKHQVKYMVGRTLMLNEARELADDATDALAIALCHLFQVKTAPMRKRT